jgi:hypothetical protein
MPHRYYIPLSRTPGVGGVWLSEPDGYAEIGVTDAETPAVLEWLERLLDGRKEDGSQLKAGDFVVSDRDRLLAEAYRQQFGPLIDQTEVCGHCGKPFDIQFSLDDLMNHLLERDSEPAARRESGGAYRLPDGTVFRLPTGVDELALAALPADRREQGLLERCIVESEVLTDARVVEAAMMEAGPLLETRLVTQCVECGEGKEIHFDIQSLFFQRLVKERWEVMRQVHLLAGAYKWGREEILRLGRTERRAYCQLIQNEMR